MIFVVSRVIRLALRLGLMGLAAGLVYLVVTTVQIYQAAQRDQAAPAQVIVVMGAAQYDGKPSPDFVARLDHAYALWKAGYAPLVAVTGGRQSGDQFTEADAGRAYLITRGVPAGQLVDSGEGSNSWESLVALAPRLHARHDTTVILVSDPFHNARVAAMASALALTPLVSPTHTSPLRGATLVPYYVKETVGLALGRLVGFARLSSLSHSLGLVPATSGSG